jgi:hypothetical protein
MISAKEAVIWVNHETREVMVWPHGGGCPHCRRGHWRDPIGAAYSEWKAMTKKQRVGLMLETAIDLAMNGFALKDVLVAFSRVKEFRGLGSESYPMCRALTSALVGECLEPNTMSFEELLQHHGRAE